jgi:hypothetical protein
MISPRTEEEARHGKPTLLTDCDIALLVAALPKIEVPSACSEEAAVRLWNKLLALWTEDNTPGC